MANTTPDIGRVPFGFSSNGDRRIGTRVNSFVLGPMALRVGAACGRLLPASLNHRLARAWGHRVLRTLDVDLTMSGLDEVERGSQYLVMPLHESFIDIPTLLHLPLDLVFAVRGEIADEPWARAYIRASRHVVVPENRSMSSMRTLVRDVSAVFDAGANVVVFPQGSVLGIEVAFQHGVGRLARLLGKPVLPVAISGTHRVWEFPFAQTVRYGQRVTMTVLPPIPASGVTTESIRMAEQLMKKVALASNSQPRRFEPDRDGWWDGYSFDIDPAFPGLATRVAGRRQPLS